jgi:tetratricopeptide (TPR) repeat protein
MINLKWPVLIIFTAWITACSSAPPEKPPELASEADTLIGNGVAEYNQANYAKANLLFEQAMYLYRSIDDPRGTASAYINLAKTALSQNQISDTEHWLQRAQQIVDREQLNTLQNHITITRSSVAIERKDFATAKLLLTSLLNESASTTDRDTRLAATQNRTRIAFAENNDAATWTERFVNLASSSPAALARAARFRAALSTDSAEQDNQYQLALNTYRKLAWRPGLAATLSEWAEHNIRMQNYSGAEDKLRRALLIRLDLHDKHDTVQVLKQLETVYRKLGQATKQQRAAYWQTRIVDESFADWSSVLKDFET